MDNTIVEDTTVKKTKLNPSDEERVKAKKLNPSDEERAQAKKLNPSDEEKFEAKKATTPIVDTPVKKTTKKTTTSTKIVRSKKYQEVSRDLDRNQRLSLSEAVARVKTLSYSSFTGTMEAHINTNATGIRGLVSLPFASGKKLTILAFGRGAEESGADVIGNDEVIESINKGKVDFDLLVTTPEWMPRLAKVARILGPRSLMPNPKNGTITTDLRKAVESFQAGKTEYKTEPKGKVIHLGLGKLDQPNEELAANIKTLVQTIGKTRVKKVSLAPTLGPSVKVELSSI